MSRTSKTECRAQQKARRIEFETTEWAKFAATYHVRFANLLFKYMELSYDQFNVMKVDDETYAFDLADSYLTYDLTVTLPASYNRSYMDTVEKLEFELSRYYARLKEANRQTSVRAAALNKLTDEERRLLGVQ